jgi:hypothetical protein
MLSGVWKFGSALLAIAVFPNVKLYLLLDPLRPIFINYSFRDLKGPLFFQVRTAIGAREELTNDG